MFFAHLWKGRICLLLIITVKAQGQSSAELSVCIDLSSSSLHPCECESLQVALPLHEKVTKRSLLEVRSGTVPYRSSLRYNSMVHDVSHGYKSKHLSIHAWKAARSVSTRSWARPPGALILLRAHRTASFETSQDGVNISEHISNALPQSKEFCVLFALYGLVSYPGSLTLTSSGRYEIHWLNFILKVVAAILAAWLAKFLTSLLAC